VTNSAGSISQAEKAPDARRVGSRRLALALIAASAALAVLWALDPFIIRTNVLTRYNELSAVAPIYAFWQPILRWQAIVFLLLCAGAVGFVPMLLRRAKPWQFGVTIALAAILLPLALFAVRKPVGELGAQFQIYPKEEYLYDARRIDNLLGGLPAFLRRYVKLVREPSVSTHGATHPPGNAALLYLIGKPFRFSLPAVGFEILLLFAAGAVVTYLWMREICGEAGARIAALLTLASPSVLNFACTSMDAVFFLLTGLAIWPGIVAFSARGGIRHAVAAGAALFLAMMFSFSAFPVGLLLAVYGGVILVRRKGLALQQLGIILIAFIASYLLTAWLTSFDLWADFVAAREQDSSQMTHFMGRAAHELYLKLVYGNAAAFLIGCGTAVVALLGLRIVSLVKPPEGVKRHFDPFLIATLVTLPVMCAGGLFTMETERIWFFAIPWLAALGARIALDMNEARWLLAAGWAQSLGMAVLLFTLW
jgi:hypothetical protein